jgi:pantetheine-phosphate adenylyltransferase
MVFSSSIVFPGSFDPITKGHFDIISRAVTIFDTVVVAVLENPLKSPLFSLEERKNFILSACNQFEKRVVVDHFSGLLVDYLKQKNIRLVLRGLRAVSDYEYEAQIALMNRHLDAQVETFFLMAREDCAYISSNIVKQIARFGGDVRRLVPESAALALEHKFKATK